MIAVAVHADDLRRAVAVDVGGRKVGPRRHQVGPAGGEELVPVRAADRLDLTLELIADGLDRHDDVGNIVGVDGAVAVVVGEVHDDGSRVGLSALERLELLGKTERGHRQRSAAEDAPFGEAGREVSGARRGRVAHVPDRGHRRNVEREAATHPPRRLADDAAVEEHAAICIQQRKGSRAEDLERSAKPVRTRAGIDRLQLSDGDIDGERHLDEVPAHRVAGRVPVRIAFVGQTLLHVADELTARRDGSRQQLHEIRLDKRLAANEAGADHLQLRKRGEEQVPRAGRRRQPHTPDARHVRNIERGIEERARDFDRTAVVELDTVGVDQLEDCGADIAVGLAAAGLDGDLRDRDISRKDDFDRTTEGRHFVDRLSSMAQRRQLLGALSTVTPGMRAARFTFSARTNSPGFITCGV